MAWNLIAHLGEGPGSGGGTTSAINTTGADLIVVAIGDIEPPGIVLSDSKGNTYTASVIGSDPAGASNNFLRFYYCFAPIVGSGHTFTSAAAFGVFTVTAWSGAASSPLDASTNNANRSDGSTTQQPGSITPGANNELVITVNWRNGSGLTATINGGFTITDDVPQIGGVNYGGSQAYLIQTSAAAANPTWTFSGSPAQSIAVIAAFKVAAVTFTWQNLQLGQRDPVWAKTEIIGY